MPQSDYKSPIITKNDSGDKVVEYFDTYFDAPISFPANDLDAVTGFFESRGFGEVSSIAISAVILQQAKAENIPVMKIIDTLRDFDPPKINQIVSQILNNYRSNTSALGQQANKPQSEYASRNIKA